MIHSARSKHSMIVRLLRGVFLAAALLAALSPAVLAAEPGFGEVKVLAKVPQPGFPEGIVRRGPLTFVTGPATFGLAGNGIPSKIWAYSTLTGNLVYTKDVVGEDLNQEHANSCAAIDGYGQLYVLNLQLGIIRFDPWLTTQQQYSKPFPDLKPCQEVAPGTPCSPVPVDLPPLPNDIAFDMGGNAYVTDSLQATIWRVPAGGGVPEIWFQDVRLAPSLEIPGSIGANGIRINPQHNKVYVSVTIDTNGLGNIYTLPLGNHPAFGSMKLFHRFAPGDFPDGMAFGASGVLYVASAKPFNSGIIGLSGNGAELFRLTNPPGSPINPYDSPANIAFNGLGSLLVTNHAFATGGTNPEQFQVLQVYVNDQEAGLFKPLIQPSESLNKATPILFLSQQPSIGKASPSLFLAQQPSIGKASPGLFLAQQPLSGKATPILFLSQQSSAEEVERLLQTNLDGLGIGPQFGLKLLGITGDDHSGGTIVRVQLTQGRGESATSLNNFGVLVFRADGMLADYHSPLPPDEGNSIPDNNRD